MEENPLEDLDASGCLALLCFTGSDLNGLAGSPGISNIRSSREDLNMRQGQADLCLF